MKEITFNKLIIILAVVLFSGMAVVNYVVNPYGFYADTLLSTPKYEHDRIRKAQEIKRLDPEIVVVGSSRCEDGMDPSLYPATSQNTYNYCIPGTIIYETYRNIQHVLATTNAKSIIVGLDFFAFSGNATLASNFSERRLATDVNNNPQSVDVREHFNALLSKDALDASIKTIEKYKEGLPATTHYNGASNTFYKSREVEEQGGHLEAAIDFEKSYIEKGSGWLPAPDFKYTFINYKTNESTISYINKIIALGQSRSVTVHFYISPIHARLQSAIYSVGLWEKYNEWKMLIAAEAANYAVATNTTPVAIYDFGTINSYTTESLSGVSQWYWESAHFKADLGVKIFDRILGEQAGGEEFGEIVMPNEASQKYARETAKLARYVQNNKVEINAIFETSKKLGTASPAHGIETLLQYADD